MNFSGYLLFSTDERTNGSGPLQIAWQKTTGNSIAVVGAKNTVFILNRHGEMLEEIKLPGVCTGLSWDREGDNLAVINNRSGVVFLWDANTHKMTNLESGMGPNDALTCVIWSNTSAVLAIGNAKGKLLLYNHQTSRKLPVFVDKHSGRISCGAFNDKNWLALGSDDETISVSDENGETTHKFSCHGSPGNIQFAEMKESERSDSENTISALIGSKTLMLINLNDPENPINLQFQARYGQLTSYSWFGDGYILIGFSHGYLVSISTHVSEIGQEIFSIQEHKQSLSCVAVNHSFGKAFCAGDSSLKIRELANMQDIYAILPIENSERGLDKCCPSEDGQLLAISTMSGTMHVYLTRLPVLSAVFRTKLALLSSLTEVTIINEVEQEKPISFMLTVEPSFVSVGQHHAAAGMNNQVTFYKINSHGAEEIREKEYMGTVNKVFLNSAYACVMFDGKCQIHPIEGKQTDENENRMFPDQDKSSSQITCASLTDEFLVFGTNAGHIQYFFLEDWKNVNEYRHIMGIRGIFPEPGGCRLVIIDERKDAYLYNPVNDQILPVAECSGKALFVLWENFAPDRDIFVVGDQEKLMTFMFYRDTVQGSKLIHVGNSKLPHNQIPLLLFNGQVTCQAQSGKTNNVSLTTHQFDDSYAGKSQKELEIMFQKAVILKRWPNAWTVAIQMGSADTWKKLGKAGMMHLDVDFAMRVYRQLGDVGMVWSLESIKDTDDRNLLAGHLAMFLDEFDMAEELYLQSTSPICALELRRDLLHWEKALTLANRLAHDQIPYISKEYAQQLEFTGSYSVSLSHYQKAAIDNTNNDKSIDDHNNSCKAGIARMALRTGDIRNGIKIAMDSGNRSLKRECAAILESMKQFNEAAGLYENGNYFDKAAAVYLRSKNWTKVGELLPQVNSPKIHIQYAKAMEAEKKYKVALEAYKSAKDYDNAVRVLLEHLNSLDAAVKMVRDTKSIEGAKLVAKHYLKQNDQNSAIQFLVLSQCRQEAMKLAQQYGLMEEFARAVGEDGEPDEFEIMAEHFETKHDNKLAGKYYYLAGRYSKTLNHLISNGEDHESIKLAIECVGKSNDPELRRKLTSFLMGEMDGIPKDAKYLFRLYMAMKMYREAAKVAVIIAREEQTNGNYRVAHDVLFSMYHELRNQRIKIPAEMETNLMLIHSYLLAKLHIKQNDHKLAARMLIRVAGTISKFPSHAVPILTSTVIECQKAGLKSSAFKFAAMLIRPEYRSKLDDKYKKKIEQIVRKPDKNEEEDEPNSPCPFCQSNVAETTLLCSNCQNTIPYCIATGKHMTKNDFSCCPGCRFPALYNPFKKLCEAHVACPMCGIDAQPVAAVEVIENIDNFLNPPAEAD